MIERLYPADELLEFAQRMNKTSSHRFANSFTDSAIRLSVTFAELLRRAGIELHPDHLSVGTLMFWQALRRTRLEPADARLYGEKVSRAFQETINQLKNWVAELA